MTIKITHLGGNQYEAKGRPAISNVGMFFGIIFIISGVLGMIAGSYIASGIILFIANMILFASNRHTRTVQQRKINEAHSYKRLI